jgi:hypothetical protein
LWGDTTGDSLVQTEYNFPLADGGVNQILQRTATNTVSWVDIPTAIATPATSTINQVVLWGDLLGKTLIKTDYVLPVTDGTADQILQTDGAGAVTWIDVPATIVTPATTTINRVALWGDATGDTLIEGEYTMPITDGTADQVLQTDGAGAVTFVDLPVAYAVHQEFSPAALVDAGQIPIIATATSGFQLIKITSAADVVLNTAPFSGAPFVDGLEVTLLNIGAFYVRISYSDLAGGALVNGNAEIPPQGMLTLIYTLTENRWREKNRSF